MEQYVTLQQARILKNLEFKEKVLTYFQSSLVKLCNEHTGKNFNNSSSSCSSRPTINDVLYGLQKHITLFITLNLYGEIVKNYMSILLLLVIKKM